MVLIQPLPADLVHLMAAGEVIDSLAAAVRELAENALDAGADRITISLWPGQWRLQVADNGHGMTLDDLRQAAAPHSTSKLAQAQDLWQIRSLGFRGQALHSLAQLADLTLCSRPPGEAAPGWQVAYDRNGQPRQAVTVAIAPGTIVTVSQLFQPWPQRRDSLPGIAATLRAVQQTIQHLALCHPRVTWQLHRDDRPWLVLWPAASALALLPQMVKPIQPSDLRAFDQPHVSGLVGLPDRCHRRRPDWVLVGLNGRPIDCPALTQAILAVFQHSLPRHRHPVAFVHLQLPPDQIDWNRHPAKTEVYVQQLDHWCDRIQLVLRQTLGLSAAASDNGRVAPLLKAAEAQGGYGATVTASPLPQLTALAQVHQRYILAEREDGLCLIEQHIAHERVLYEQLCDQWPVVPLATPVILPQLTESQQQQLADLGLSVASFGEDLWAIRSAPAPLADRPDLAEALVELSQGRDLDTALVATACRTAIRNGTGLSLGEMQQLLDQWQRTRQPRTCPHGRPICLTLAESSLSRFFRRHWVIGKSHGI